MVQRYPSSGIPVEPQRPPAPQAVLNAVKLMYAGAAITTVSLVILLVEVGTIKPALRNEYPHWTASQVNQGFESVLARAVISAVIGIVLWLWMAWANNRGVSWARIVATVLFALDTLLSLLGLSVGPRTPIDLVFPVLTWLVGLGAIWLLWRPDSTAFFKPQGSR